LSGEAAGTTLPFRARPRLRARDLIHTIRLGPANGCGITADDGKRRQVAATRQCTAGVARGGGIVTGNSGFCLALLHTPAVGGCARHEAVPPAAREGDL